MFLSKIRLRPDASLHALSRSVGLDNLAGDVSKHALIWSVYGDHPDRKRDFVWREIGRNQFISLSAREPEDRESIFDIDARPFNPTFVVGQRLRFSLHANATVWTKQRGARNGKREDVLTRALRELSIKVPDAGPEQKQEVRHRTALEWFRKQGDIGGFSVSADEFVLDHHDFISIPRKTGAPMQFGTITIKGLVTLTDANAFRERLTTGYGHSKAFGCGLMMVMSPANLGR